jgi:hypothetical protein
MDTHTASAFSILSAAFACGIAVSGIIQFFAVQYKGSEIDWVRYRLILSFGIEFHLGDP